MKSLWSISAFVLCLACLTQAAPSWFDAVSGLPSKKGGESSYIRFGKRSQNEDQLLHRLLQVNSENLKNLPKLKTKAASNNRIEANLIGIFRP